MEANDRERSHLQYLLADFQAIKSEIARRSNLQRVVLGAYIGVYAWLFPQFLSNRASTISVAALWTSAMLALLFHERERLEITRLAGLIRNRIALEAAQIISVAPEALIPSEVRSEIANPAQPGRDAEREIRTRRYDFVFTWSLFLLVPLLTTGIFVYVRLPKILQLLRFIRMELWGSA